MMLDFFKILSDHLLGKPSNNDVSPELSNLADVHQLLPIIYYQTKHEPLHTAYLKAISVYTQRRAIINQVKIAFSDIPFFIVKGVSVSQYYPIPQLRTMSDCDIIVCENDKEMAKKALVSMGFNYIRDNDSSTEWHFEKQGLIFELHHCLLYDEITSTEQEKRFTDKAWEYVVNHELDVNYHFVFILIHLKKHLLNSGVGIRQFMDLAVMSMNAGLDYAIVNDFIVQTGLEKFAGVCSELCLRWFGVSLPVKRYKIDDKFYSSATKLILSNGVFGFENQENKYNGVINSVREYGKNKSIIRKFFPSYKDCIGTAKYNWVYRKPYLMPFMWVYRPFEFLFSGKAGMGIKYLLAVKKSSSLIDNRNELMVKWGIWR